MDEFTEGAHGLARFRGLDVGTREAGQQTLIRYPGVLPEMLEKMVSQPAHALVSEFYGT